MISMLHARANASVAEHVLAPTHKSRLFDALKTDGTIVFLHSLLDKRNIFLSRDVHSCFVYTGQVVRGLVPRRATPPHTINGGKQPSARSANCANAHLCLCGVVQALAFFRKVEPNRLSIEVW